MDGQNMWDDFFQEEEETTEEPTAEETEAEETEMDEQAGAETYGGDPVDNADNDPEGVGTEGGSKDDPEASTKETAEDATDTNVGSKEQGGFTAEMRARIDAETQRRVDAAIARQFAGMTNPYTGRPIRTEAELNAYKAAFEAEEQQRKFDELGVDAGMLKEYVDRHPRVQQAERMMQAQQQREAMDFLQKDFQALQEEYPDSGLKEVGDLLKTDAGRKALDIWKGNKDVSMADAYAMTHRAEIKQREAEARQREMDALKQGMRNQMNSKTHLTQTKGNGGGGDEIPTDALEGLKMFMPGKSHAEYVAIYKKNQKNTR